MQFAVGIQQGTSNLHCLPKTKFLVVIIPSMLLLAGMNDIGKPTGYRADEKEKRFSK